MGSVLGDITDAIGLTDYAGQEAAQDSYNKEMDRANELADEQLQFQMDQYNDWKDIYGPIQEDLGTYYKNLNGDSITSKKLAEIQKASQNYQTQIDQSLAQRGLDKSGLSAGLTSDNLYNTEMIKADTRANSDQAAAEQQMQFLGLGLGQGTNMLGTISNTNATGVNSATNLANSALGTRTTLSTSNTGVVNDLWGATMGTNVSGSGTSLGSSLLGGLV